MPITYKKKGEVKGSETAPPWTEQSAVPPPPNLPSILQELTQAIIDTKDVILKYAPVMGTVQTEFKQNKQVVHETNDTAVVGQVPSIGPMCQVGVEASNTINLGNFNSMRVGVTISIPCQYKDIQKTYELAQEWVNVKMEELQEQVNESGG